MKPTDPKPTDPKPVVVVDCFQCHDTIDGDKDCPACAGFGLLLVGPDGKPIFAPTRPEPVLVA